MDEIINEIYGKGKKATPNPAPSTVEGEGGEDTSFPSNESSQAIDTNLSPSTSTGEGCPQDGKGVEPSRAFFNRVKNRFLQGLSSLTKEEE